jgi:hypothetical protein
VAVSRARDRAIVVADAAYLERCGNAIVRHFIREHRERGQIHDASEIASTAA